MAADTSPLYRGMNKDEIRHQYRASVWSSRNDRQKVLQQFSQVTAERSKVTYETIQHEKDVRYGERERERYDIFAPDCLPADAPVFVFIHGGYWIGEVYTSYALMAPGFTSAGAAVVTMEYTLAPAVKLEDMVSEIQQAVVQVCEWAEKRGSRGLYISGHSAGGHLSAMCMLHSHPSFKIIKGLILMSGIYDVRPLTYTSVAETMPLTEDYAWEQSPMNHLPELIKGCQDKRVVVLLGGQESPEFKRQSQELNQSLLEGGVSSEYLEIPDVDHFSLIESLSDRESKLSTLVLNFMDCGKKN